MTDYVFQKIKKKVKGYLHSFSGVYVDMAYIYNKIELKIMICTIDNRNKTKFKFIRVVNTFNEEVSNDIVSLTYDYVNALCEASNDLKML